MTGDTKLFGKYRLAKRIGVGGMAEVWLATAAGPGGVTRPVAVKRILPHLAEDREFLTMFFDEARILARLNHPNIVQIHEMGKTDWGYALVMEFVHGANMEKVLKVCARQGRKLPIEYAVKIVSYVCEGLEYAHNFTAPDGRPLELVHRDLSPGNIMINFDGVVKILDFGVAKAAGNLTKTRPSFLKGKAAYMAPEQIAQAEDLDRRVDVFSLGVSLFEFVTGQRPFDGGTELQVMMAITQKPTPDATALCPDVPAELSEILKKALSKKREERYGSAREMRADLETFLFNRRLLVDQVALAGFLRELARTKTTGSIPAVSSAGPIPTPTAIPVSRESAKSLTPAPAVAVSTPAASPAPAPAAASPPPPPAPSDSPAAPASPPPTPAPHRTEPPRPMGFGLGTMPGEEPPRPVSRSPILIAGVVLLLLGGAGAAVLLATRTGGSSSRSMPESGSAKPAQEEPFAPDAGARAVEQTVEGADGGTSAAVAMVDTKDAKPAPSADDKAFPNAGVDAGADAPASKFAAVPSPPVAGGRPTPKKPATRSAGTPAKIPSGPREDDVLVESPKESPSSPAVAEVAPPPAPVADPPLILPAPTPPSPLPSPPADETSGPAAPAAPPTYQPPEVVRKRRIAGVEPEYPPIARQTQREATLLVKIRISAQGEISEIRFLKTDPLFEDVVREAIKTWRFSPATINGRPIETYTNYKFVFSLGP